MTAPLPAPETGDTPMLLLALLAHALQGLWTVLLVTGAIWAALAVLVAAAAWGCHDRDRT